MNSKALLSVIAAGATMLPTAGFAAHTSSPEVDSPITIQFTVISQGGVVSRNGTNRITANKTRLGSREVLGILENINGSAFPRGSRLVATTDNGVLVLDRSGEIVFDASSYVSVSLNRRDQIFAGTTRDGSPDVRGTYQLLVTLGLNFSPLLAIESSEGDSSPTDSLNTELTAGGTERYSERFNRFRETLTTSSNISVRYSGAGSNNDGPVIVSGSFRMSGRGESRDD